MTLQEVEDSIVDAIKLTTGVLITDKDSNLLSEQYAFPLADFLYIFHSLEEKYDCNIYEIINMITYEKFTISAIAQKIIDLL